MERYFNMKNKQNFFLFFLMLRGSLLTVESCSSKIQRRSYETVGFEEINHKIYQNSIFHIKDWNQLLLKYLYFVRFYFSILFICILQGLSSNKRCKRQIISTTSDNKSSWRWSCSTFWRAISFQIQSWDDWRFYN